MGVGDLGGAMIHRSHWHTYTYIHSIDIQHPHTQTHTYTQGYHALSDFLRQGNVVSRTIAPSLARMLARCHAQSYHPCPEDYALGACVCKIIRLCSGDGKGLLMLVTYQHNSVTQPTH